MKNRKMLPGCHAADALGVATAEPTNRVAGSPLLTTAADATNGAEPPTSRRLAAAATQPDGPDTGPSPPPAPNHANTVGLTPLAPPRAAERRATATPTGRTADPDRVDGHSSAESSTATTESAKSEDSGNETDSRATKFASAIPESPGAEPGRLTCDFATEEPLAVPPPAEERTRERTGPRTDTLVDDPAEADDSEPTDPAEPVVSANATGTAAIAEPTPNATASAPTRPT